MREFERLPHGSGEGQIPENDAESLAAVARSSAFAGAGEVGVLEHHRAFLRARNVVGMIVAPRASLEILPKIDLPPGEAGDTATEAGALRRRLVHMLAVALDLRIETGTVTALSWQRETLLEILIRIFCVKLSAQLRRGMPRRYISQEDDLPALRGRIDVARQFTRHAANPSRLACRFDALSEDIALNRIIRATINHLAGISFSSANQQRLRELGFAYADVTEVPVSALRWDLVVLDRTNRGWAELVALAKLFLRGRYQNTSAGRADGTSLLFEMDALFEAYVARLVRRALTGTDLVPDVQGGGLCCLIEADTNRGLFRTRPDILIRRGGSVVQVVDTKWKRIAARIDDRKQGVSQADVYQMMAYAQLYHAPKVTLLYPHHHGLPGKEGVQATHRFTGGDQALELTSLDISRGEIILARIKEMLLGHAVDV
ncbi:McrC family protein [Thioclava sediminum]|uniref:McrC family protein n=1 Tax=Thioclava sediminum TaxID=1915319 RepID=UPI001FC8ED86|nr:McrC family protein [Thioclava sediminum]